MYRYQHIDKSLYIHNRRNFISKLKPSSIAILNSNDIMPTNADGTMGFRQNNDLLFLSGIDQEESVLVIFPDAADPKMREILFLRETNEEIAIWEGERLSKEQARAISGIENIFWVQDFHKILQTLVPFAEHIYLNTNEHTRADIQVQTRDAKFIKWCKEHYPLHKYERLFPILSELRVAKHSLEVAAIQHACDITEKGFRRLLSFIKPGVTEFEIEAELIHEFIRNRSKGFAYTPIIASGFDSCVLHYIQNKKECKDGDILLLDVAAEYANYNSDLSRTIPVNGRYTTRQKAVYNATLRVHRALVQMMRPGITLRQINLKAGLLMEKELVDLGLITNEDIRNQNPAWPAYKKYFMHGASHFLGLDVHDVGYFDKPLRAGAVLTCEPGIYIREEELGVRIENNILVTDGAPIDLMQNIPIEAEEIEDLMNN